MGLQSLEQVQRQENKIIRNLDKATAEISLQRKMEDLLPLAEEQYGEYFKNGEKKLWQMQNAGVVACVKEARALLSEHGSSQIIQQKLEESEIETENDDARILAFCRLLETNKRSEN